MGSLWHCFTQIYHNSRDNLYQFVKARLAKWLLSTKISPTRMSLWTMKASVDQRENFVASDSSDTYFWNRYERKATNCKILRFCKSKCRNKLPVSSCEFYHAALWTHVLSVYKDSKARFTAPQAGMNKMHYSCSKIMITTILGIDRHSTS